MALGFPPRSIFSFFVEARGSEAVLQCAEHAVSRLGWRIGAKSSSRLLAYTKLSWRSWGEEIDITVRGDRAEIVSRSIGLLFFDWGKNEANLRDFFRPFFYSMKSSIPLESTNSACESQDTSALPGFPAPADPPRGGARFVRAFLPRSDYFVTPILIDWNIAIFLLMVFSGVHFLNPATQDLLDWGANLRVLTRDGQWWRLLTACFLHGGLVHLVVNMFALSYVGSALESLLGRTRLLSVYLATGAFASAASLFWYERVASVGASGAIFGLYGVFLVLLLKKHVEPARRSVLLKSTFFFLTFNLFNGFKQAGIDNAAHVGGLASGLAAGVALDFVLRSQSTKKRKSVAFASIIGVLLASSTSVYLSTSNDLGVYLSKLKEWDANERLAVKAVKSIQEKLKMHPHEKFEDEMLEINAAACSFWARNVKIVEDIERLSLPLENQIRNRVIARYSSLSLESLKLMDRGLRGEGQKGDIETINRIAKEIVALRRELGSNQNEDE